MLRPSRNDNRVSNPIKIREIELKKLDLKDAKVIEQKLHFRNFIYDHLGEFRDSREEIEECLDYAFNETKGGHLYIAIDGAGDIPAAGESEKGDLLLGIAVILNTNMVKFVPEHLLVYMAVRPDCRGQGIGRKLLERAQRDPQGSMALHVEPHNPAVNLYKRMGFTNKYLEMRFVK